MRKNLSLFIAILLLLAPAFHFAEADLIDDLKQKIKEQNERLQQINEEISVYQKEVQKVGAEKQTLQTAVKTLDLSRQKLQKDIGATESRIYAASLTIDKLNLEIKDIEDRVDRNKDALGQALRAVHATEEESIIETLLAHQNVSEVWDDIESLARFKSNINDRVVELEDLKSVLGEKVAENVATKTNLEGFKEDLSDQKQVVEINKQEKNKLLTATQSKEAEYNRILQEKIAQKKAFEQALFDLESQLNIAIDPSKLPAAGKGVLRWPLDNIVITQYFGKTSSSGRLYASGTHNGVDFGTAIGTSVRSAQSGVIWATGDTDAQAGCYSYGKWILVKHNNGLSTLYAHLSLIKVGAGDSVNAGSVIGYSGNTGYSTGPHLHFSVYATEGVRVQKYTNSVNCQNVTIPVADPKAYLDPMIYL